MPKIIVKDVYAMSEKKIIASEAVYVSERNPCINNAHSPFIAVGFSGFMPFSHCEAQHRYRRAENIGLLQFPGFDLPPDCEILNVRLYLFVSHVQCTIRHIQVHANAETFIGNIVNWVNRPEMQPVPITDLQVERVGVYSFCDITPFIKESDPLSDNNWGFTLVPVEQGSDGVAFFSRQAGFYPYISIIYSKRPSPP